MPTLISADTFFVTGSTGCIEVDCRTGQVLTSIHQRIMDAAGGIGYSDISRFDTKNFYRLNGEHVRPREVYDILTLGFWLYSGEYIPAVLPLGACPSTKPIE